MYIYAINIGGGETNPLIATGTVTINPVHNPYGCVDSYSGGAGVINIAGWAKDDDAPDQGIDVHVYVGGPAGSGELLNAIHANKYRSDVGNHSFSETIKTNKTGKQDIYVYAINVGGGENVLIAIGTVTINPAHNPYGCVDSYSGGAGVINIAGWARDDDAPDQGIDVHVYVGGPAGSGELLNAIHANKYRSDVGNHLFSETVKTNKTGKQDIYVYAINVGGGENVLIATGTVTINPAHNPYGCVDSYSGGAGVINIAGWAKDDDVPDQGIDVHVYIGGPSGSGVSPVGIHANKYRSDVGNHSFSETIKTDKTGSQDVYVYAINVGGGENVLIGTGKVTITPAKKDLSKYSLILSNDTYSYDGTPKTPDVTVKDENTVLIRNTDYSVSYTNNIDPGTATVTITGIGKYTGKITKEFKINRVFQEPAISLSQNNGILTASVSNTDHATGYGFIYGTEADVTLNTPGRTRISYSEMESDGRYTFDASELTGRTIRAYVTYTDKDGAVQVVYSNPIVR